MLKCTMSDAAIAIALAMTAPMPAFSQAVISEPGYCAFFYPNANCLNKGPGNPYTDPNFHRSAGAPEWAADQTVGVASAHARMHRSHHAKARLE